VTLSRLIYTIFLSIVFTLLLCTLLTLTKRNNQMTLWPSQQIDTSFTLPTGDFQFLCDTPEIVRTKDTNKLMVRILWLAEEPSSHKGRKHTEWYVVAGDNPEEVDANCMGAKNFKRCLESCQVPEPETLELAVAALKGSRCVISILRYTEEEGQRKGQDANRILNYFKIGQRTPLVKEDLQGAGGMKVPGMPQGMAPPGVPLTGAPPVAPPIVPPGPPVVAPPIAPPGGAIQEPMIPCPKCGVAFPSSQIGPHIVSCVGPTV